MIIIPVCCAATAADGWPPAPVNTVAPDTLAPWGEPPTTPPQQPQKGGANSGSYHDAIDAGLHGHHGDAYAQDNAPADQAPSEGVYADRYGRGKQQYATSAPGAGPSNNTPAAASQPAPAGVLYGGKTLEQIQAEYDAAPGAPPWSASGYVLHCVYLLFSLCASSRCVLGMHMLRLLAAIALCMRS